MESIIREDWNLLKDLFGKTPTNSQVIQFRKAMSGKPFTIQFIGNTERLTKPAIHKDQVDLFVIEWENYWEQHG